MDEECLFVEGRSGPVLGLMRADRFFPRMRGLLGRSSLAHDSGMWIAPCASVHTFGMRFPIDVLFVDRDGAIVRIAEDVPAGRLASARRAASVVEIAAGGARRLGFEAGHRLRLGRTPTGLQVPLTRAAARRLEKETVA